VRLYHLHKVGAEGGGGGAAQLAGQHGLSTAGGSRQVLLPRKAGQGLDLNIRHQQILKHADVIYYFFLTKVSLLFIFVLFKL
jgi:hypothetical protein